MKAANINTLTDAQRYVEGCLNDLVDGISTKDETIKYLGEYTFRLMELFEKNDIRLILRSAKIELLEKYSLFLEKNGYMDIDWKTEPPFAIDEFLKTTKNN